VSDPTCQRPDGLHLLRLANLGLEPLALGDVPGDGGCPDGSPGGVLDGRDGEEDIDSPASFLIRTVS
jgi:hypothetical protein